METQNLTKIVHISCPICKAKKNIEIPNSLVNEASHITTISIPKGKICKHTFQAFIDKNYAIRGYQKVDFELDAQNLDDVNNSKIIHGSKQKNLTLKDIYEEFWELIDDDNKVFKKFIRKDKRRQKIAEINDLPDMKKNFIDLITKNL